MLTPNPQGAESYTFKKKYVLLLGFHNSIFANFTLLIMKNFSFGTIFEHYLLRILRY